MFKCYELIKDIKNYDLKQIGELINKVVAGLPKSQAIREKTIRNALEEVGEDGIQWGDLLEILPVNFEYNYFQENIIPTKRPLTFEDLESIYVSDKYANFIKGCHIFDDPSDYRYGSSYALYKTKWRDIKRTMLYMYRGEWMHNRILLRDLVATAYYQTDENFKIFQNRVRWAKKLLTGDEEGNSLAAESILCDIFFEEGKYGRPINQQTVNDASYDACVDFWRAQLANDYIMEIKPECIEVESLDDGRFMENMVSMKIPARAPYVVFGEWQDYDTPHPENRDMDIVQVSETDRIPHLEADIEKIFNDLSTDAQYAYLNEQHTTIFTVGRKTTKLVSSLLPRVWFSIPYKYTFLTSALASIELRETCAEMISPRQCLTQMGDFASKIIPMLDDCLIEDYDSVVSAAELAHDEINQYMYDNLNQATRTFIANMLGYGRGYHSDPCHKSMTTTEMTIFKRLSRRFCALLEWAEKYVPENHHLVIPVGRNEKLSEQALRQLGINMVYPRYYIKIEPVAYKDFNYGKLWQANKVPSKAPKAMNFLFGLFSALSLKFILTTPYVAHDEAQFPRSTTWIDGVDPKKSNYYRSGIVFPFPSTKYCTQHVTELQFCDSEAIIAMPTPLTHLNETFCMFPDFHVSLRINAAIDKFRTLYANLTEHETHKELRRDLVRELTNLGRVYRDKVGEESGVSMIVRSQLYHEVTEAYAYSLSYFSLIVLNGKHKQKIIAGKPEDIPNSEASIEDLLPQVFGMLSVKDIECLVPRATHARFGKNL